MEKYDLLNDSDDDSLPDLNILFPPSSSTKKSHKKSINELLQDTISIAEDYKTDYMLEKEAESFMENISKTNITSQGDELVIPQSPVSEVADEIELNLFCANNYLQYFNLRDITFQNCGYSKICHSDLTQFEEFLITTKPVNIENVLSTIVSVFSVSFNEESCFKHMKPFMYYLLKILSLHENEASVQACEHVLRTFLNRQSGIMFTSEEIFILLFNYGVDVKSLENMEIFAAIPEVKMTSKSYSSASTIPFNWLYNLEVLLSAVEDLISNYCFANSDLSTMVKYFLGMYLDSSIQNEYPIISQLQTCIATALETISDEGWPDSFSSIYKFIMSLEKISDLNSWQIIYQVDKFLPIATKRMSQLQMHVSLTCLKKLSGDTSENEPASLTVNYTLSDLQHILESIHRVEAQNYHIFIKFLDICISHLNLESKEDHLELYDALKDWEDIISNSDFSTLKEQQLLVRMRTKIFLMTPEQPSEMVKQIENIKCELESDYCGLPDNISLSKIMKHIKKEPEESNGFSDFHSPLLHNSLDTPLSIKPSIINSPLSTVRNCAFDIKEEQEQNNEIFSEDNNSVLSFCSEKSDSPLILSSPVDREIYDHNLVKNVPTVKTLTDDEETTLVSPLDCFESSKSDAVDTDINFINVDYSKIQKAKIKNKSNNFDSVVYSKPHNSPITNNSNALDNYNSADSLEYCIPGINSQSDIVNIDNNENFNINLKHFKSPLTNKLKNTNISVNCTPVDDLKFINSPISSEIKTKDPNIDCDVVERSEHSLSAIEMQSATITESENKVQSPNGLKVYTTTKLTTSVTINTPSDKTIDTKPGQYHFSSDIAIIPNQATDPIPNIHVTISALQMSPVPDEDIVELPKWPSNSVDSVSNKLASDRKMPGVYTYQMPNGIICLSDSEEDIEVLSITSSVKRSKTSGDNNVPLKKAKSDQVSPSKEKVKSPSNIPSLFNFGVTSSSNRTASLSNTKSNTLPKTHRNDDSEIQILYSSMDDDCQIIANRNDVVTLD